MKHALLAAMLVAVVSATQAELTPSQIAKKAFPSTVLIVTQDESGQPLSIGSGFFVEKGVIATNFHVIEGAASAYARLVTESTKHTILGVLGVDQKNDLALLKIDNTTSPPLSLSSGKDYGIGETVYSVGNPKGLEGTFASGIVSGVRKIKGSDLIQITAPISPGSSGGPILNKDGLVIGVAVATFKSGQNLNFAVPVAYAKDLLNTPKRTFSKFISVKRKKSKSLITEDLGTSNTKGIEITNLEFVYKTIRDSGFSFSIKNNLNQPVSDIIALIIFTDIKNEPIDYMVYRSKTRNEDTVIPPKLAKRFDAKTTNKSTNTIYSDFEYRILNFRIHDEVSSGLDLLDF
ncbi:S1C family serine protease [bacterium]|nr:S1C family serine protease [bacterium]